MFVEEYVRLLVGVQSCLSCIKFAVFIPLLFSCKNNKFIINLLNLCKKIAR